MLVYVAALSAASARSVSDDAPVDTSSVVNWSHAAVIVAPAGTGTFRIRTPTTCTVLPSVVSSRSELETDVLPEFTDCSASSDPAATRSSTVCGPLPPAPCTTTVISSNALSWPSFAVSRST